MAFRTDHKEMVEIPPPAYNDVAIKSSLPPTTTTLNLRPDDIIIALMGITGSGKSSFISHFVKDIEVGHSLESCTSDVTIYESVYNSTTRVYFVDTPGFDDTYKTDTEVLREIADWLSQAYGNIELTGIIYLHRISDVRVGNSAMKNLRMFRKLCGNDALASVVLATTWWDFVEPEIGVQRESELLKKDDFWAYMISQKACVFRQDRGENSAREIVNYLISKRRKVTLKIQEELVREQKPLDKTSAGIEVESQLEAQKRDFEEKIKEFQEEIKQAIYERDAKYEETLKSLIVKTQKSIENAEADKQRLHADRVELQKQMEAQRIEERKRLESKIQETGEKVRSQDEKLKIMALQHEQELTQQQLEQERKTKERLQRQLKRKQYELECLVM